MRESVAAFRRRTGIAYEPPARLRAIARPLGPRDACPTLFRYPGPEGLRDLLGGALARLAPPEASWVWLATDPLAKLAQPQAVRHFGSVAVLQPLRFSPCATGNAGAYLGVNRSLEDQDEVVWVPAAAAAQPLSWDQIRTAAAARRSFGTDYPSARAATLDRLNAYLEELSALRRAGAPLPEAPWCRLSTRERLRILRRYGQTPRWTQL